jgi:S1-C subfamily serine protease
VLRWNDKAVLSPSMLTNFVAQTEIGSTAQVQVNRDGRELSFDVKVGERPKQ